MKNPENTSAIPLSLKVAFALGVVSFIAVNALYFSKFHGPLSDTSNEWSAYGDFVGGTLNPTLAFLTFMAIIVTIRLQIRELQATLAELRQTKEIHEAQAKIMEQESATLRRQQFEARLFELIRNWNAITDQVIHFHHTGRAALLLLKRHIEDSIFRPNEQTPEVIPDRLAEFSLTYQDKLDHYIKYFFFILRQVKEQSSVESTETAETYRKMLRAQLSTAELHLLFYLGITYPHADFDVKLLKELRIFLEIGHMNWIEFLHGNLTERTSRYYL